MTAEIFWKQYKIDSNDCWIWQRSKTKLGYGKCVFQHRKDFWGAHQLAWFLTYGKIPEGMHVCHSCDVPACINPKHLFLGTPFDNMQDAWKKGRFKNHAKAKLSAIQVREIRLQYKEGISISEICDRFSISDPQAYKIVHRQCWKQI